MARIIRSSISIGLVTVLVAAFQPALAGSTDPVVSYSEKDKINEYSRPGAENSWGWDDGFSAEWRAQCSSNGTWNKDAKGICYKAGSDSCSVSNGCGCTDTCNKNWGTRHAKPLDMSIGRISNCTSDVCLGRVGDAPGSPSNPEITDNTGDAQLMIIPGGDGYVEIIKDVDGTSVGRINWFKYTVSGDPLMVPMKKNDYISMLNGAGSSGHYQVENACMPANFSANCPSKPGCSCYCPPCPTP